MNPIDDRIRLQLFQAMVDRSNEGVVFVDSQNKIRYWNRVASAQFGLESDRFALDPSVIHCVVPTPEERQRLRSNSSVALSGFVNSDGSSELQPPFERVIESINVDGDQWLIVRLKRCQLHSNSESELYLQARTDHLSQLLNRRGFQATLEENLHRRLAVAIIDVDFFKNINDTHGHEIGDHAIQWLADQLRSCFPDAVCVGRLGGDEFGVVLEVLNRDVIKNGFRGFCEQVDTCPVAWNPDGISVSIGVAIANAAGVAARELLTKSDRAMYQSKKDGRNRATFVDV